MFCMCMHAASAGVLGKCWFETETQVIFEGDQLCTLYRIQQSRQKHFTHTRSHNEHRDDCRLTPCVSAVSCRCHTRQNIHIFSFIPLKKTATSVLFIIQCFQAACNLLMLMMLFLACQQGVNAALVSMKSFSILMRSLQRSLKPQTTTVNSLCINPKTPTSSCERLLIKQTYVHVSTEYEFIGVIFDCQSLCS